MSMQITWDEPKRLDKHEMDFADLTLEFFKNATVYPARKSLENVSSPSARSATASSPP